MVIQISPAILEGDDLSAAPEEINKATPIAPIIIPNDLIQVIFSFKINHKSSR